MQEGREKYDVIGDTHGCHNQFVQLVEKLGYKADDDWPDAWKWTHPEGRQLVFVGDICDRGPENLFMLTVALNHLTVRGNHCDKLIRWLKGNKVTPSHGLQKTIDDLVENSGQSWRDWALTEMEKWPTRLVLDEGRLVVVHGAEAHRRESEKKARSVNLFGYTTGKTNEEGFPERIDWAQDFKGDYTVVHGHQVVPEVRVINNVWNIDTGCVFGGKLTALRYPEMEIVQVDGWNPECSDTLEAH